MPEFHIPYGRKYLDIQIPQPFYALEISPADVAGLPDPLQAAAGALDNPVRGRRLEDFRGARSAAIAINDKTRPVAHHYLLPPLLDRLESLGIAPDQISLILATGTHAPMPPKEYPLVVSQDIINRYHVISHDHNDSSHLIYKGKTPAGTPVWVNRLYDAADLRLTVGNMEPHQFQGFSGGVKSAAIGLANSVTINANHAMMSHPNARPGRYEDNPGRMDIEEIGRLMDVHFALNAIPNARKEFAHVLAGDPWEVMRVGVPLARRVYEAEVEEPYDLVVSSPGGYPKDINFYQAQKGLLHGGLVTREGGTIILVAACSEGTGSRSYDKWMADLHSFEDVFACWDRVGFHVGLHKAYLVARDATRAKVILVSDLEPDFVREKLLLTPAASLAIALAEVLSRLSPGARIGIMPRANATIPIVKGV